MKVEIAFTNYKSTIYKYKLVGYLRVLFRKFSVTCGYDFRLHFQDHGASKFYRDWQMKYKEGRDYES